MPVIEQSDSVEIESCQVLLTTHSYSGLLFLSALRVTLQPQTEGTPKKTFSWILAERQGSDPSDTSSNLYHVLLFWRKFHSDVEKAKKELTFRVNRRE
jgi:hypothetical protein